MAGLENLPIYHELQEDGSMLCAQHALNSLLQGQYFTAVDLSAIARNLDELEESYDDNNQGTRSGNMDDSGFFSVQVLENALKVWGFRLARWRSEEMRPLQDHPETQQAFILNYAQHWYTLRRFGPHWFNLNSFSLKPEWISKLYLGIVLQQAESDGYSVFAIVSEDPSSPALPHTEADDLASTIPEPSSASRPSFASGSTSMAGMEEEDLELQAALQASLMGDASVEAPPPVPHHSVPLPSESDSPSTSQYATPQEDADPVTASMQRNRVLLERMKAEQEYARNQLWGERETEEMHDTEEEMLRRAMEESEATGVPIQVPPESQSHLSSRFGRDRVYDDDDAELQAALKASLEEMPEGWALPDPRPPQNSSLVDLDPPVLSTQPQAAEEASDEEESAPAAEAEEVPLEQVSVDELRRRRLAKFGS